MDDVTHASRILLRSWCVIAVVFVAYGCGVARGAALLSSDTSAVLSSALVSSPGLSFVVTLDSASNLTWNPILASLSASGVTSSVEALSVVSTSFSSQLISYEDPFGLPAITQSLSVASIAVSRNLLSLNLTLSTVTCYAPKERDVLTIAFGSNATVAAPSGAAATTSSSLLRVSITVVLDTSSGTTTRDDEKQAGLVVVGIICVLCAMSFLLGDWSGSLLTLLQLQLLVLLCYTSCAPPSAAWIFQSCIWVIWPLSTYSSDVHDPEDQGRMVFTFVFVGIALVVQLVAVALFTQFSSRRRHAIMAAASTSAHQNGGGIRKDASGAAPTRVGFSTESLVVDPKSRAKFPQGVLFVAGFLFQGAVRSSVKTFALFTVNLLGGSSATGPLALAVVMSIFCLVYLVIAWVAVFRVVSKQVYLEPLTKSFFVWAFLGGSWKDQDSRRQWGVLFDCLNGSGFWVLLALLTLSGLHAMMAGFVPGSMDSCTTQYYVMLVISVVLSVLMFVRRPFKSLFPNLLNTAVSLIHAVVCVAFVSSMECSRLNSNFARVSAWFSLCAIFVKATLMMVLQIVVVVRRSINRPATAGRGWESSGTAVQPKPRTEVELLRHALDQATAAAMESQAGDEEHEGAASKSLAVLQMLLQESESRVHERSVVLPMASAGDGALQRHSTLHKPLLPIPRLLDSVVLTREVGFGGPGGLPSNDGPSLAIKLQQPCGMCCDANFLYVVDTANHRVLQHDIAHRRTTTLCGNSSLRGYAGDLTRDGASSAVLMDEPRFVTLGHNCVYVSDTGNDCVRQIDLITRTVATVVGGSASRATIALSRPMGMQVQGTTLFIADSGHHRIVAFDFVDHSCSVVCGTGFPGYDGDNTFAAMSRLNAPQGLSLRPSDGNLFIADTGNHRVCVLDASTKRLRTVMGTSGRSGAASHGGADAGFIAARSIPLCLPTDVASGPQGSLLIVDAGNAQVWFLNRFEYARVIVPASELVVPRHVAVPRRFVTSDSEPAPLGAAGTSPRFRSGGPLSSQLPQHRKSEASPGVVPSAVVDPYSFPDAAFVFFVSDSVQHMIVSVDASQERQHRFQNEHLHALRHPESLIGGGMGGVGSSPSASTNVATRLRFSPSSQHPSPADAGVAHTSTLGASLRGGGTPARSRHVDGHSAEAEEGDSLVLATAISPIERQHSPTALSFIHGGPSFIAALPSGVATSSGSPPTYQRPVIGRASSGATRDAAQRSLSPSVRSNGNNGVVTLPPLGGSRPLVSVVRTSPQPATGTGTFSPLELSAASRYSISDDDSDL